MPPWEIVVSPVYVFVPLRVNVPVPVFASPPDPWMTPEKVLFVASPAVNVWPLAISIVPAPSIDLIVSLASTS